MPHLRGFHNGGDFPTHPIPTFAILFSLNPHPLEGAKGGAPEKLPLHLRLSFHADFTGCGESVSDFVIPSGARNLSSI